MNKKALLGICAVTPLALFLGYGLCYACWMTAYHSDPGLLKTWQVRFYVYLVGLLITGGVDLYLLIRLIRGKASIHCSSCGASTFKTEASESWYIEEPEDLVQDLADWFCPACRPKAKRPHRLPDYLAMLNKKFGLSLKLEDLIR